MRDRGNPTSAQGMLLGFWHLPNLYRINVHRVITHLVIQEPKSRTNIQNNRMTMTAGEQSSSHMPKIAEMSSQSNTSKQISGTSHINIPRVTP